MSSALSSRANASAARTEGSPNRSAGHAMYLRMTDRRSPRRAPLQSSSRGIISFRLCLCRFQTENRFPFFHQVEPIARDRFQIGCVALEQTDLARLAGEQGLLIVHLRLKVVDLRVPALHFFGWRHE